MLMVADVDLGQLVRGAIPGLQQLAGAGVTIHVDGCAAPCVARVDAGQVERALANLATNARDAMPHGGRLGFVTREVDGPSIGLPGRASVRLSASDDGCGISVEHLPRVFEPFFTTKPVGKGTGLGLAMVYGSVKQMGGDVRVSSVPGRGTTFDLYFPAASDQPAS
jgi:signal transduction histidine kinase